MRSNKRGRTISKCRSFLWQAAFAPALEKRFCLFLLPSSVLGCVGTLPSNVPQYSGRRVWVQGSRCQTDSEVPNSYKPACSTGGISNSQMLGSPLAILLITAYLYLEC